MLSLLNGLVLPKLKGHTQDICLQASVAVCNSAKTGCDELQAPTQQSYQFLAVMQAFSRNGQVLSASKSLF